MLKDEKLPDIEIPSANFFHLSKIVRTEHRCTGHK